MLKRLSLLLLFSSVAFADTSKLVFDVGFFSISADAGGNTSSISNPSAFRVGYLRQLTQKLELNLSYSIMLADFSGSDMGFGPDIGVNYYLLTNSTDETYQDSSHSVRISEIWKPYIGVAFSQRNFQSVKNSYAGLGGSIGVERYYSEKINFRAEGRYINLAGTGDSKATETGFFLGMVYKL